ncbi:MAG: NUDIX hydrolase [Desulfobacteraceae bacterium]|nr:MAG: NUDIX hydrolase [Desulfobacteraceae bacterium]
MLVNVNSRILLHQGRTFHFVKENVTLENGVTVDLEIVRHPGAAAIVALSSPKTVVLLRQYRHALGRHIWEIPAGTLNPSESALECAKRELVEETGYSAAEWRKLGEITPVPGYSDERIHLFLAGSLSPAKQNLDHDEVLDVHEVQLEEAMKMVSRGDIQDGKTICSLFLAKAACQ